MNNISKIQSIAKWLSQKNIDIAFINNFNTIKYLTGFNSDPIERVLALIIFKDKEPFIFCPSLEVEAIKENNWPYEIYSYMDDEDPYKLIANTIYKNISNPQKIAIEAKNLTVFKLKKLTNLFPNTNFSTYIDDYIDQLRVIKSEQEIELLLKAGKDADFAFQTAFNKIHEGVTEQQISTEIDYSLKKKGTMHTSFDPLIQFGKHAAEPHGETSDIKATKNELILIDLGTVYNNYISDATRTVALGKITDRQKDIYNICLEANLEAINAIKPGISAKELDGIARNIITKYGYGDYFIHRLGHGIGQSEHEYPDISQSSNIILKKGMCFSIEPGIYIPNELGVRIEDCVYVTKNGCKTFTNTTKKLLQL